MGELEPSRPGVIATHLPPSVMMRPGGGHKYVVMMRDPLDTLLSLHSQNAKILGPGAPTLEEIYKHVFRNMVHGYAKFNLQWWKEHKKHPEQVMFVFYEEAVANLTEAVVNIGSFLGKKLDVEAIERIRFKSSVEYMKPMKDKFEPPSCVRRSKESTFPFLKELTFRGSATLAWYELLGTL